jgi:SAM-dependent methyltransferase
MRPSNYNLSLPPVRPAVGYDLAARYYDAWSWQRVWRSVEWPIIDDFLQGFAKRSGGIESLLDVGSGTGSFLNHAIEEFRIQQPFGIDISPRMLDLARQKLGRSAHLSIADARNLMLPSNRFDVVLICRVASHLPDIGTLMAEMRRVLRAGGLLIVTDLDPCHPYNHTRLPWGQTKIPVATYKHPLVEWRGVLRNLGFAGFEMRRVNRRQIVDAKPDQLPSSVAFSSAQFVSFVIAATKYRH